MNRVLFWLLDKLERLTVWIHRERKLDAYETGKAAWEIRNLKKSFNGRKTGGAK